MTWIRPIALTSSLICLSDARRSIVLSFLTGLAGTSAGSGWFSLDAVSFPPGPPSGRLPGGAAAAWSPASASRFHSSLTFLLMLGESKVSIWIPPALASPHSSKDRFTTPARRSQSVGSLPGACWRGRFVVAESAAWFWSCLCWSYRSLKEVERDVSEDVFFDLTRLVEATFFLGGTGLCSSCEETSTTAFLPSNKR